jgi:tripartite-type tricarboxylate transporter receptor subunit TctC
VPNAISATLYDKLNFNFISDIASVASISREPLVMVVHPSLPARTVPEFVTYAKANPGKINMARNAALASSRLSATPPLGPSWAPAARCCARHSSA